MQNPSNLIHPGSYFGRSENCIAHIAPSSMTHSSAYLRTDRHDIPAPRSEASPPKASTNPAERSLHLPHPIALSIRLSTELLRQVHATRRVRRMESRDMWREVHIHPRPN